MNDLWGSLLEILICALVGMIIVLARQGAALIKAYLEANHLDIVAQWVDAAVAAAEQSIVGNGADKYAVVFQHVKKLCGGKNMNFSDQQINNLIESAVYCLKKGKAAS